MRQYALLIVLCICAFLPGIATLPPIDRDEPRFLQASKQMAETGDLVDIRFQDESRYKKPVGIYWLHNAALALSGQGSDAPIWVYRLVSVLGGIIAVCATFAIGRNLFGDRAGLIAAIALAGVFGLGFEARIAKTDAMLLATAVLAQGALARLYLAGRGTQRPAGNAVWLFWIAEAAAILIKGPIVPLLGILTIATLAVFDRDRRWLCDLKPLRGIALAALLVSPWIVAISLKSGWAFWQESIGRDLMGKVASGQESHGFPPGYYVLTFSLFLWPFGAMATEGGLAALNRFRSDPRLAFLLAWYLPYWIVCELLPTKLPHYMLPAYPALLLLTGWHLSGEGMTGVLKRWQVWLAHTARLAVVVVTAGLAALAVGLPIYLGHFQFWGIPSALAFIVAGWLGSGIGVDLSPLRRVAGAMFASAVAIGLLAGIVLPRLDTLWPARQIALAFTDNRPCSDSVLAAAGYTEPSLVFLTSSNTLLTSGSGAANHLKSNACAVAAVDANAQGAFMAAFAGSGAQPLALAEIDGINLSNGRQTAVTLYRLPAN
jgi:4-amino-4-deoxy-L-arabinose transferase-like glycosyltransferase